MSKPTITEEDVRRIVSEELRKVPSSLEMRYLLRRSQRMLEILRTPGAMLSWAETDALASDIARALRGGA